MSSPKWQQASEIVHAALERPLPQRPAFIKEACAGNEPLLQEVEILLRYYGTSENSPAQPPTAEPLEHWRQPSRKNSPPRTQPGQPINWFTETEARHVAPIEAAPESPRTTEELPIPNFAAPEVVNLPARQPTRELISELARGYEHIPGAAATQQAPAEQAGPATAPGLPQEPKPPVSFESPTVRPVFEQPAQNSETTQPTYRPIFEQAPKPATPPPAFDPVAQSLHLDFPGLTPSRPEAPAARSNCEQPSQRLNAEVPGLRGVAGQAPRTGALGSSAGAAPAPAPDQPQQLDGRMLAHYQLHHEIGRGGMGRVYLAQDTRLGRRVALKLLLRHSTRDPEKVRRFQQEARAASALNHPNILTIYEVGEVKGVHYLATEFVEGRTLRALIDRGRFKVAVAVEIAIQIASALDAAHRANIVHRDIKPENLMLRTDGYVKVLDFGIAKLVDGGTAERAASASSETQPHPARAAEQFETKPGLVIGSASYMSPEQARGSRVDRRTDVFSLGIVLYEMLTGHCPFKGATPSDTLAALLAHDPAPLSRYVSTAPLHVLQGLQRMLARALAKDREQRYQTAREFAADLKAFKQSLLPGQSLEQHRLPEPAPPSQVTAPPAPAVPTVEIQHATDDILIELDSPPDDTVTGQAASGAWPGSRHWRRVLVLAVVLTGLAALLYWAYGLAIKPSLPEASIAVLPFEYTKALRAGEDEREYLADGLTESLIQRLTQVPRLKVIARNSVFRYKGKTPDPHEVGQALRVNTVLTGRITPRQTAWTVTIELVDVNTSTVLWGEQYDSKLTDLHLMQSSLANRIAAQLKLRLSGAAQQRLAQRDTENLEAYKLYLKGRHFWNQRTGAALKRSIEHFQRAVQLDPHYARAFAALAESHVLAPLYAETPPEQAVAAGKDAAARALELDANLAEPHAALGFIRYQYEWNWAGAEQAYQRALALNENYATAHHWYSSLLSSLGRAQEAIQHSEQARELDPVSQPISTNLGAALYYARRYDEAAQQFLKSLELNPNAPGVLAHLGMTYEQQARLEQALATYQRALAVSGESVPMKLRYCHALARAGRQSEARKLLDELQQNAPPGAVPLYQVAATYTALGEPEQALRTLTQAVALREEELVWLKVDPQLDPLRAEGAFSSLLKNVGLLK
jgi:eukaryotic-like serine/threonine-protein kinase